MRDAHLHRYDTEWLLAEIVDGYYRAQMATASPRDDDDRKTRELELQQDDRARDESRFAREADRPANRRAHERRAEKAAYLRDKLADAERSERA